MYQKPYAVPLWISLIHHKRGTLPLSGSADITGHIMIIPFRYQVSFTPLVCRIWMYRAIKGGVPSVYRQNTMLQPKVWYQGMVSRYGIKVWYQGMVSRYGIRRPKVRLFVDRIRLFGIRLNRARDT